MSAGLFTTVTPAAVSAAIFSAAVPLPPAMIAPAWPMRRPGGAVWPAMKPTTGFLKLRLDPGGGFFFGAAADLADHDDGVGVGIVAEQLQRVDVRRADQRIAADADAGRLAQPEPRELVDRLVGQRAALRHDADAAFLADVPGNDAGLGLARRDDARAVRADEARRRPRLEERHRAHHVERRNAFGDADDERDAGVGRFHDRVGRKRRRHEDHRRVGAGLLDRVAHGVEDRPAFVRRAALAGRDAADDGGAVRRRLLRVERAFAAGEALDEQARRSCRSEQTYVHIELIANS